MSSGIKDINRLYLFSCSFIITVHFLLYIFRCSYIREISSFIICQVEVNPDGTWNEFKYIFFFQKEEEKAEAIAARVAMETETLQDFSPEIATKAEEGKLDHVFISLSN